MGKNRQIFLMIALIASISFGLILQSCVPMPSTPPPISSCGTSKDDLVSTLPGLRDKDAKGIEMEICIRDGKEEYTVVTKGLDKEQKKSLKKTKSPFQVKSLVTYFQIIDSNGNIVTEFSSPLELRITYKKEAWDAVKERGYDLPRLAYLVKKGDIWGTEWIEFTEENSSLNIISPGTKGQPKDTGLIIIEIKELGDPAIGGC